VGQSDLHRPLLIQVQIAVEPLAAVQVRIRDRFGAGDGHAEGVVLVGVAHRARSAGGEADVEVAIVAVEAWRPRPANKLILAYPLQAVGVVFITEPLTRPSNAAQPEVVAQCD
jgi:hypothetical protein